MSFAARLAEHALRRPDAPALVTAHATVGYAELERDVRAWAHALRASGIAPGAIVAITLRSEVEHMAATLALFALGVSTVALASRDPPASRTRLARRVGATVLVGDRADDAIDGVRFVDAGAVRAAARAMREPAALAAVAPLEHAIYLTGSGTTGEPKIVSYSERQLALHADVHLHFADERVLRPAHVEYNNSKRMRLYLLWQGGACLLSDGSTESLRSQCIRLGANWLELSPMHGKDVVETARTEGPMPSSLRIRIGGARVPYALRRAVVDEVAPNLYVSYGTTETSFVAIADPSMHDARETVGPPQRNVTVEVIRADGGCAAPEEVGEIRIRGPGMSSGYIGDAEATARHFRDGWFVPGDLASMTRDGRLVIHGRADDMMIMNSINIFPVEIERILESHPAVAAAAAFPLPSPVHGQIPLAVVELRDGEHCTPGELVAYARDLLGVRAPRRVEVVATLPRNPQGKVIKRALAERYARGES